MFENIEKEKAIYNPTLLALSLATSSPVGALLNGISGSVGRFSLSFFNPALASSAGTFWTFAGVGAIAGPLALIPLLLKEEFFDKSSLLEDHPTLKDSLSKIAETLIQLGSITSAALILGLPPFGATVISMMVVSVALNTLGSLCLLVSDCLNYDHGIQCQL